MTPSASLWLTANVQEAPRHDDTIDDDFREVHRYVEKHNGSVVCWQELGNDHYRAALARAFGPHWLHLFHQSGHDVESPVSVNLDEWKVLDSGAEPFSPPIPKMQVGRKVTWAHLQRKRTGREVIVSSRHYVARAWAFDGSDSPRPDNDEAAQQPERQRIWREARDADVALVRKLADHGVPQVIAGDFNRNQVSAMPDHVNRERCHHLPHGIDWIHLLDAPGRKWKVGDRDTIKLHADHDAFGVHAAVRVG